MWQEVRASVEDVLELRIQGAGHQQVSVGQGCSCVLRVRFSD